MTRACAFRVRALSGVSCISSTTMSNVSFRDLTVVLIDTSRTVIQAGIGLHDLLRTPAVVRTTPSFSRTVF